MKMKLADIMRQFTVFCSVGVINTLATLALIFLLSNVFGVVYTLANFLGYALGVLIGFALHRSITFKTEAREQGQSLRTQFVKFLVVFAVAYSIQFMGLVAMVQFLLVPEIAAQIVAVGIYVGISFLGNRIITFRTNTKDRK